MRGRPVKKKVANKKKTKAKAAPKKRSKREDHHVYDGPVTEERLLKELPEDLREAWFKIRQRALELGEQRLYASHRSIMFARKVVYAFVRPKKRFLELVFFLLRHEDSGLLKNVTKVSKVKYAHLMQITHGDQIEGPLMEWLAEAYALAGGQTSPA